MDGSRRRFIAGSVAAVSAALAHASPGRALARRRYTPLFEDDLRRRDRYGWGSDWFNQRYDRRWAIRSRRGIYRMPETTTRNTYRPNPVLVLDHDVADVDLRVTLATSNKTARIGLVARASNYADYYAVSLAPDDLLRVLRCGSQSQTKLAKSRVRYVANRRYRLRMQVKGNGPVRIRAKAWPAGTPEPLRWQIETVDSGADAITSKGAFGVLFQHATDRRSAVGRAVDFVAHSGERPSTSAPQIVFAFAGPPSRGVTRLVAKTSVPSYIRFQIASDPTFTKVVERTAAKQTNRALAAKATVDVSAFPPSTPVYWRAIATRGSSTVVGPTSSFRTPSDAGLPIRFAFGSCTKWEVSPKVSFEHARLKLPDFYLHQGDLGYATRRVAAHGPDTYQDHWTRVLMDPHLQAMTREVPMALLRDDADYGTDNANKETLQRFTIGAHDAINTNPAGYFETRYGDLAVFSIDCRRYSTTTLIPADQRTKLGLTQRRWLKESMRRAVADDVGLLVVSSPMPFGSDFTPANWHRKYAAEWTDMMDFFQKLPAPVLIVSGHAHGHRLHEYPQKGLQPDVPRIVEIVSSGTEQTTFFDEIDPQFLVNKAKGSGFGLIELGAEREIGGQRTRSLTLSAVKTSDGQPFWTANYIVVRGVGLFPVT